MTIKELLRSERLLDIFILSRYMYKIGEPIISDPLYNNLEKFLKINHYEKAKDYLERTYDDDPIPEELLKEVNYKKVEYDIPTDNKETYYKYLNDEKSLSIKSVTDYEEAYKFFSRYREEKQDLMTSMKLDGNFSKSLYIEDKLVLSLSRGRSGNSFDFTNTIKNTIPKVIDTGIKELKVYAECFVSTSYLETLRRKNPKHSGYVSPKSAAISLLRVEHDKEDYAFLNVIPFFIEGLSDKIDETFRKATDLGFTVVPHKLLSWEDIPVKKDDFCEWLKKEVFDYFAELKEVYASDGIVVEVNDLNYTGITKNQYVDRQLALKFEQWSFDIAQGIVEDIVWEQRRVNASIRLKIKPVNVNGTTAQWINAFNPAIVINENIKKGSTVYFERNSDAYNVLLYGENLRKVLGK